MMKIISVVGARPQFIKAAAVSRAVRHFERSRLGNSCVQDMIVHTGQHYDQNLSELFFSELDLPVPTHYLAVGSGSHGAQTGRMLEKLESVLIEERPDWVLVYGDTNSTVAGALAAAKLDIPVAHIEAGLRSYNRRMPEEINRVVTDHLSSLLFCPTDTAVNNLKREGIDNLIDMGGSGDNFTLISGTLNRTDQWIVEVGDVMYDAALFYGQKADHCSQVCKRLGLNDEQYILATIHRAENTDNPRCLSIIWKAFQEVAKTSKIVVPLHPRTALALERHGIASRPLDNLLIIDPVGYLDMIQLIKRAKLVATDSGGVQKESFFFKTPCVTLRNETEWVELVDNGWNRLVPPTSAGLIVDALLHSELEGKTCQIDLYGDGRAAEKIVAVLNCLTRAKPAFTKGLQEM